MRRAAILAVVAAALSWPALIGQEGPAFAASLEQRQAEKCARYKQAYAAATSRQGMQGLGADFLHQHDAFLASGCTSSAPVCARTAEEVKLANLLIVLGMNQGMASTFFPFRCRK